MNINEFGSFLSQLRKEKGLTQKQLAEMLNVTDKAVSRWETGKNYPDIEIFEDLSKILDVSISELLEGKRIERDNLLNVSEENVIKQIKRTRSFDKKYKIIISIAIAIIVVSTSFAMKNNGFFDGVIYNKIPAYSNDILTVMNNVDGYIAQRPKSKGAFIINYGFFFIEHDKTTNDIFYLSGTCENGRSFYINTIYDEKNPRENNCFIGEFRKNQECAQGIAFGDLKKIVSQIDLSALPEYEKYQMDLVGIQTFNKKDLNINEHQKNIKKFIFSEGVLQDFRKRTISGKFFLITISGFNNGSGEDIAHIYCKK